MHCLVYPIDVSSRENEIFDSTHLKQPAVHFIVQWIVTLGIINRHRTDKAHCSSDSLSERTYNKNVKKFFCETSVHKMKSSKIFFAVFVAIGCIALVNGARIRLQDMTLKPIEERKNGDFEQCSYVTLSVEDLENLPAEVIYLQKSTFFTKSHSITFHTFITK